MALIGKIRGMRMRDGKSISEISRLTSLSRNTIKKWLKVPQSAAPKYRRRGVATKLAPYVQTLTQALEVDARRAKHERRDRPRTSRPAQDAGLRRRLHRAD